ncbi:MAG TPA: SRPBCC domain-containing protein [Gemmatimonadaceae bacterium]|nr:SRPBCC domain-containing protein [Gemmatimonadaceae bacterium]
MADKLVIKRSYNAPIDVAWDAWADPSKAKAWWGPRGFTAPVVELDERPGGKWRAKMVGPDGAELWQHGVYREIVPKKRIVYTFIWDQEPDHEMLVTVDFVGSGNKTDITFQQTGFKSDGEREGHKGGWGESFDRLGEFLEQRSGGGKKQQSSKSEGAANARR